MLPHLALPQEGHLIHLLQVFSYLRKYHNSELLLDPSDPVIDTSLFERKYWTSSEFAHVGGKEELPPKMPQQRGIVFVLQAKVYAYHAADTVTRISRTGFQIYSNCDTVYWFSNNQTSADSSSFDSKLVANNQF